MCEGMVFHLAKEKLKEQLLHNVCLHKHGPTMFV